MKVPGPALFIAAFLLAWQSAQAQYSPYNDFAGQPPMPYQAQPYPARGSNMPISGMPLNDYARRQQSQFYNGSSDSQMSQIDHPWTVDTWRGGRRRRLHFDNDNGIGQNQYQSQYQNQSQGQYQGQGPGLYQMSNFAPQNFGAVPSALDGMHPDHFADAPQVDAQGVRHFANGRHHDLGTMSVDQAVAESASSDDQIRQEERQRKLMARRRRANGFN